MSGVASRMRELYVRLEHVLASGRSPLLLLIRLYWGWQFAQSGWGKVTNLSHVTQFFTSLHLPLPAFTAFCIALLELIGGLLLIVGLLSRVTALLLALDMGVAFVVADREALRTIFSDPGKFYAADPFTFLSASLLIAMLGAGVVSLDYLLAGHREIGAESAAAAAG